MQLISDEYRKLNTQFHRENKHFGNNGAVYLTDIISLIKQLKTTSILDYGCGKGALANNLPFSIRQYDPAIPKHAHLPEPADLVVCTDVIEHIEPDHLDDVLKHISSLIIKFAYLVISIVPACKTLPDGRNAHLIIKDYHWWLNKILEYFDLITFQHAENRIIVTVAPLKKKDQ